MSYDFLDHLADTPNWLQIATLTGWSRDEAEAWRQRYLDADDADRDAITAELRAAVS
jgi:hypothetical protein